MEPQGQEGAREQKGVVGEGKESAGSHEGDECDSVAAAAAGAGKHVESGGKKSVSPKQDHPAGQAEEEEGFTEAEQEQMR